MLVEGIPAAVGAMTEAIRPHVRHPVQEHRPQARLLRWLHERNGSVQVAATSADPLFALVEAGRFDASLYYRRNTVRITF